MQPLLTEALFCQVDELGVLKIFDTNKTEPLREMQLNLDKEMRDNMQRPETVIKIIQSNNSDKKRLFILTQKRLFCFEIKISTDRR